MNNEDKTFLLLKYGDYHSNPYLILVLDDETLSKIWSKSIGTYASGTGYILRSEIDWHIRHYRKEMIAAIDEVLYVKEQRG